MLNPVLVAVVLMVVVLAATGTAHETYFDGAVAGPYLLDLPGFRNWAARGLAIGTARHGIGTARALRANEATGAFSGPAVGLYALATAVRLPLLWHLFFVGSGGGR